MKAAAYMLLGLFIVSTGGQAVMADEGAPAPSLHLNSPEDDSYPLRLSDMPMHLNTQAGVSSFEYSAEGSSKPKVAGGATLEFGEGPYRAETGALFIQRASLTSFKGQADQTVVQSNLLGIPLMAKIRVFSTPIQSWSLKLGVIQTFELSSNKSEATNKIDSLASMGLSCRLAFTRRADFIIEGSYNRGLIPALRAAHDDTYNEGILVLAGLSFRL